MSRMRKSTKFIAAVIVWALSLAYAVFVCVDCFMGRTLDMRFIVLATLLLVSASIQQVSTKVNTENNGKVTENPIRNVK